MLEYPSIPHVHKSNMIGDTVVIFDKLDGSNFRVKWTPKKGFCLFGTRTQLIDSNTPYWGAIVTLFQETIAAKLEQYLIRNKNDTMIFSEYYGDNSFAGIHVDDEPHKLVVFDVYDLKTKSFLPPDVFCNTITQLVETPKVIEYGVQLNADLIEKIKNGFYNVSEGVICKSLKKSGASCGKVPMCKIKTTEYLTKLKTRFKDSWEKYN